MNNLQIIIILVTGFIILNVYHDGKYIELIKSGKKYYIMIGYAFIGLSIYLLIQNKPNDGAKLIKHATNMIKFMPIDKDSSDLLTPTLDRAALYLAENENKNKINNDNTLYNSKKPEVNKDNTNKKSVKRSVSEAKKKYVAGSQGWNCAHCKEQLKPWFEVDHIVRLEYGGTNDISNLEALCRECHGKKTAKEHLNIL
jgi:hypothetical protein